MGKFSEHKQKWSNCENCVLHQNRKHVVLARGTIPCQVLFVGEAPGQSEDVLGSPFVGPAGKLLDVMISHTLDGQYDYAITNLVGCIPLYRSTYKTSFDGPEIDGGLYMSDPGRKEIDACRERLVEFIEVLARPRLVITVGNLATKHMPKGNYTTVSIVHPSAILRMNKMAQPLEIKRAVAVINDALDDIAACNDE